MSADEIAKLVKESVAKGIKDGLRGLQAEVVAVRRACDANSTTLSTLSTTVNNQGIGTERTAFALQKLSGAVEGGLSSFMEQAGAKDEKTERKGDQSAPSAESICAAAERGDINARRHLATVNEAHLKDVRKVYQTTLKKEMFTTDVSCKSFPTSASTRRHRINAIQVVLKLSEDDAEAYLDSCQFYHGKNKASMPVKQRVASKLVLTLPHIFQGMKRLVVPVFLRSVNLTKKDITSDICELWKEDDTYCKSPKGRAAIATALSAIYRKEGLLERIIKPRGVGQLSYVQASTGFYAQVSMLIRSYLDDIIAREEKSKKDQESCDGAESDDRNGKDTGDGDSDGEKDGDDLGANDSKRMMYNTRWQAELIRVNAFLPRSTNALYGVALVDGDSPYRATSGPAERDSDAEESE